MCSACSEITGSGTYFVAFRSQAKTSPTKGVAPGSLARLLSSLYISPSKLTKSQQAWRIHSRIWIGVVCVVLARYFRPVLMYAPAVFPQYESGEIRAL